MRLTVAILLLISAAASAKTDQKSEQSKTTDKRELLEGNYGDRTYLKNVFRSLQEYNDHELAAKDHSYSHSSHQIPKISDVLTSDGPHYSAISDHLYSPVSAYNSKLSLSSLDDNSELRYGTSEHKPKSSKKHSKKSKSQPKRTHASHDPKPYHFDHHSNFDDYHHELPQFKNFYHEPHHAIDTGLFSPRVFAQPAAVVPPVVRPVPTPHYYPQIYHQPLAYPNPGVALQRELVQPIHYLHGGIPKLYAPGAQHLVPGVTYAHDVQQVIPSASYAQVAQQVVPNVAYAQGVQQLVPNVAYAQGVQHVGPNVAYARGFQQLGPNVAYAQNAQQLLASVAYGQNAQQAAHNVAYAQNVQGGQQFVPGVTYVQNAQQPGVIYAQQQNQQAEATGVQSQPFRVAEQQQAPQHHAHVQQQNNQGAVSYASFSQSLPSHVQSQAFTAPQEQQQGPRVYIQGSNQNLLPARPDVSEVSVQPLPTPVPDSQPQPQQIQIQPDQQQSVLRPLNPFQPLTPVVPLQYISPQPQVQNKDLNEPQQIVQVSPQPLQPESSNQESSVQAAPRPDAHSQSTEAPVQVSTEHAVQTQSQQVSQDNRQQQRDPTVAVEKEVTYIQQVPSQLYTQDVAYQPTALVHGSVSPTFPSVQYFGNFAESLFKNYNR